MAPRTGYYGSMLAPEEALRKLSERGARMTAQRRAVLDILSGNNAHPTADEIVALVRRRLGCVSSATIYNTLDTLEEMGFVRRIDGLEQRAHFDPDTSVHQHAVCTKCRRVWDVAPMSCPDDLPEGFGVTDIIVQGVCSKCEGTTQGSQGRQTKQEKEIRQER